MSRIARLGARACALLLGALCLLGGTVVAGGGDDDGSFVPGRLLVRFHTGVPEAAAEALLHAHGARTEGLIEGIDVHVVSLPARAAERALEHALHAEAAVEFAEVDALYEAEDLTPNDPLLSKQWHHAKIATPAAWASTTGSA